MTDATAPLPDLRDEFATVYLPSRNLADNTRATYLRVVDACRPANRTASKRAAFRCSERPCRARSAAPPCDSGNPVGSFESALISPSRRISGIRRPLAVTIVTTVVWGGAQYPRPSTENREPNFEMVVLGMAPRRLN